MKTIHSILASLALGLVVPGTVAAAPATFEVEISGFYQINELVNGVQRVTTVPMTNSKFIRLAGKSPADYFVALDENGTFTLIPRGVEPLLLILDIGVGATLPDNGPGPDRFVGTVADLVTGDPSFPTRFDYFEGHVRSTLVTTGGVFPVHKRGLIVGWGVSEAGDYTHFNIKFETGRRL